MDTQLYNAPLPAALEAERRSFLSARGLRGETGADCVALVRDDSGRMAACGALCGSVLREIAVRPDFEGEGACAAIVSRLIAAAYEAQKTRLFLCTKPEHKRMFGSLGFFPLAETPDALLMENSRDGLSRFLSSLEKPGGRAGAIVCNCNPFTRGHRYLIEQAALQCDALHVFVLSEEGAEFSAAERFQLALAGTADIPNCLVHESAGYLVSRATFPAYFIKEAARADDVRADLDLTLFGTRIAPALGITVRFVGTEPFCPVTRAYNARMKQLLPPMGVEVVEMARKDGISASRVREYMREKNLPALRPLVPDTTYDCILRHLSRHA